MSQWTERLDRDERSGNERTYLINSQASGERIVIQPSHLAGERLPGLEPLRLPGFKYAVELTRSVPQDLRFEWRASSVSSTDNVGTVEGLRASLAESVEVVVHQGERQRTAVAPGRVLSELHRRSDAGIPQPEELSEPLQTWRSRLVDARWQTNTGHPDYRALASEPRPRLRYLAMLLSKEVVSRNFPQPGVGAVLEELGGLLTALERSGAWRRSRED